MGTFQPVTLVKGDRTVVADTAARETELRFEGYRSAPSSKPAEAAKPSAPKN
jgi:hypothetical protein